MTEPSLAPATSPPVRYDLACGQNPRDGFTGVDLYAISAPVHFDLLKFPWPWPDSSVDELHCSHFIEHIPARNVEVGDIIKGTEDGGMLTDARAVGKDFLFAFFDECYRVLKPGGTMTVLCPNARNNRAFQDPTHRRFIVAETFLYLHEPWRKANKLDHYKVECDFDVQCDPVVPAEFTLLHPEAQMRRFTESWNVILDWQARLVSRKSK